MCRRTSSAVRVAFAQDYAPRARATLNATGLLPGTLDLVGGTGLHDDALMFPPPVRAGGSRVESADGKHAPRPSALRDAAGIATGAGLCPRRAEIPWPCLDCLPAPLPSRFAFCCVPAAVREFSRRRHSSLAGLPRLLRQAVRTTPQPVLLRPRLRQQPLQSPQALRRSLSSAVRQFNPPSADSLSRLDSERRQRGVAGTSVGVVYDQTLIWSEGLGTANVETGAPADSDTLYRVGSITKLFTDTMLLQLRDAGRLTLDDPVTNALPDLQVSNPYTGSAPTFRQIASHTSGLPREAPLNYWRTRTFPTEAELLDSLKGTSLIAAPGTVYQYSNLGVSLEGMALERVAGEPYRAWVEGHILTPLGMQSSGFELTSAARSRLAVGSSAAGSAPDVDPLPDFGALTRRPPYTPP